ncbi:hypothetical protein NQ314_018099 [Rhamnusium bicolor]|uniref:Uncharacterized protein n=1 Tax=Rhamnusium bicolor TaxID=1586634 RepID=A0AAV8WSJ5_9CUCU|nr:hypothetical protein NQ314_018099 [Rhamnusium bicolor]
MEEEKYPEAHGTKRRHPFERANIITNVFFCWLLPYFVKGFKRDLTEDDMYGPLKSHEANMLGDKLEKAWNYEVTHKKKPSLWFALIKVFRVELVLFAIFFMFIELVVKLSQPLLISRFLQFYKPNQTDMTKNEAYIYAGLIVFATFMQILCTHTYLLHVLHLAMKIRVAVCSLIYRKALKLSRSALAETTIGQMVNLLSNDVGRFDFATTHVNFYWLAPLETIVIMYLVYVYVGPTGLTGCGFLLLFIPFQMYMGKKTSQYRLRTAIRTDERVRLMSEIITGIQVIKMYTWEKPFAKLVEMVRGKEMQQIRATSVIRAIVMSCNIVLNRAAIYLCILTYILTGNKINASYVYTLTSFYSILRQVLIMSFPKAVTQFAEANVSIKRIRNFLLYEEVKLRSNTKEEQFIKYQNGINGALPGDYKNKTVGIHLKNLSVKWIDSLPDKSLQNITLEVNSNQLIAVVGPVGGGKTTLLHVILEELSPVEGTVDIVGALSYASQEPWLFGGSIRQNIIFGQEFIEKKYMDVVRVCALNRDFSLFPYGDRTLIGDRGVTLSGGQRARINLARAVYKDADIYLLDDPLSAVDTHVGKQLFDECICGYLKNKCVVLVTHQLQYLRNVQTIYLLQDGRIQASGSYAELQASDSEFIRSLSNDEEEEIVYSDKKCEEIKEEKETLNSDKDAPIQVKEERGSGVISRNVYKSYMLAGGSWFKIALLSLTFIISQITTTATDYFLNIWVNLEQWRTEHSNSAFNDTYTDDLDDPVTNKTLQSFLNMVGLIVLSIAIIIGSLNPWILVPTIVILVIFYMMRLVFLATSRDIKRVEAVTRSPIYTHLSASLQGLTTIRAFRAQDVLTKEFDNFQNKYSAPYFLFLSANRTFGFWLDFHCVIYTALVTISILFIESEIFGGNVGLALTQSMTLMGMFQWGMRQWSELENNMTSVERVQEYTEVSPEVNENTKEPPKFWPEDGNITFDNLCLRYSSDDFYVLKSLTFEINPKEKVGIVGRTGAGKSSLITALFRLTNFDGKILIDTIDTKEIPLAMLRSKISIIPQEPVLFSGTLRKNLDPFDEYNDDILWNALTEVELKNVISDLPAGLDSKMSEGGSNFSVGQRQLLCLARAIIRNNKILVLDEATANIDPQTDGLIQTTIRRKFANCTVLTIAHRLHTIMDSDRVLVMDAGKAVEFDHPHILLQNSNGVFYGLVMQTGKAMAEHLIAIAENNHKNVSL